MASFDFARLASLRSGRTEKVVPLPLELMATLSTPLKRLLSTRCNSPVLTSHIRNLVAESHPQLASVLPSGLNATVKIGPECPMSTCRSLPVLASQSRAVLS